MSAWWRAARLPAILAVCAAVVSAGLARLAPDLAAMRFYTTAFFIAIVLLAGWSGSRVARRRPGSSLLGALAGAVVGLAAATPAAVTDAVRTYWLPSPERAPESFVMHLAMLAVGAAVFVVPGWIGFMLSARSDRSRVA